MKKGLKRPIIAIGIGLLLIGGYLVVDDRMRSQELVIVPSISPDGTIVGERTSARVSLLARTIAPQFAKTAGIAKYSLNEDFSDTGMWIAHPSDDPDGDAALVYCPIGTNIAPREFFGPDPFDNASFEMYLYDYRDDKADVDHAATLLEATQYDPLTDLTAAFDKRVDIYGGDFLGKDVATNPGLVDTVSNLISNNDTVPIFVTSQMLPGTQHFVSCTVACGNYVRNTGEDCDLGSQSGSPRQDATCDSDCTFPLCGDGHVNSAAGETCDEGGESATCDDDCTAPVCGDGNLNTAAGEECDDGGSNSDTTPDACRTNCTNPVCGDGVINPLEGETCDDGALNGQPNQCNLTCTGTTSATCGNGVIESGEVCDDGNALDNDACVSCQNAFCGDGFVCSDVGTCTSGHAGGTEECDAAGLNDDLLPDACRTDCRSAFCGDGVVDTGEECDDGGTAPGDGCDAVCVIEFCGDGIVQPGLSELCDDGLHCEDSTTSCTSAGDCTGIGGGTCAQRNTNTCLNDCSPNSCGDGVINYDDTDPCDLGGGGKCSMTGDSCTVPTESTDCSFYPTETCLIDVHENTSSDFDAHDACSGTCQLRTDWSCQVCGETSCSCGLITP